MQRHVSIQLIFDLGIRQNCIDYHLRRDPPASASGRINAGAAIEIYAESEYTRKILTDKISRTDQEGNVDVFLSYLPKIAVKPRLPFDLEQKGRRYLVAVAMLQIQCP